MSNLLKDASILLKPTGYDNGSMNAIKPEDGDGDFTFVRGSAATRVNAQGLVENVQIISSELITNGNFSQQGSERVTNGDFSTDSDWAKGTGITISGGSVNFTGNANSSLTQSGVASLNKSYRATFTVRNYVSGAIDINLGGFTRQGNISANGTYDFYIAVSNGTTLYFQEDASNGFVGSVDNVSVVEVGQDWTLQSEWSIGTNKAIYDNSGGGSLFQNFTWQVGKKYKITFDIGDFTTSHRFDIYSGSSFIKVSTIESNTSYTILFDGDGGNTFRFRGLTTESFSVTNISVKEITDDTNLPRINYEGFSYQDALGSEVGDDVNFDNPLDWNLTGQSTIANGKAQIVQDNTSNTGIGANTKITNKTYKITGVVSDYVSGSAGFASSGSTSPRELIPSRNGEFAIYYTSTRSTPSTWNIQRIVSPCNLKIDNVSVKEYLGQEVVPDSGCGSWLLEPQSTNLVTYSEDFSDSSWNKSNCTVGSESVSSPSGVIGVSSVTNTALFGRISTVKNLTNAVSYSYSFFCKNIDITTPLSIHLNNSGITIDTFTPTSEWVKYMFTWTSSSTITETIAIQDRIGSALGSYMIWGAQLEQQSYATSYIPTDGATSTRLQDKASDSGNATLINSTEGVLYAEISALANDGTNRVISLSDGTTNNRVSIVLGTSQKQIRGQVLSSGTSFDFSTISYNTLNKNKIAISYKLNDFKMYINGTEVATDTSGNTPVGMNTMSFNAGATNSLHFYGENKTLAVYKEALTDANLRCLTYPDPVATTFDLNFKTIAEQFTFTRGSEATFVNAKGLIESTNQIGSELITNGDFATDSDWTYGSDWTISNGVASASGSAFSSLSPTTLISVSAGVTYKITFDLNYTSGALRTKIGGTQTGYLGYNVGNNFVEIFLTAVNTTNFSLISANLNGSIDNVSVKEVTIATNTPRLDYSTGAEAFLLEPQSTNLVEYSESFDNSYWTKNGATVTSGFSAPSVDSPLGAFKLVTNNVTNQSYISRDLTVTETGVYTLSVLAKKGENNFIALTGLNPFTISYFDLNNGITLGNTAASSNIENYGNGWYRCSTTFTANTTTKFCGVYLSPNGTSINATSIPNGEGVYIFASQLEQQSSTTSYIPTAGAAATRNQETCGDATPVINSTEGTLYVEISALSNDSGGKWISLSNGTSSERVSISYRNERIRLYIVNSSGLIWDYQDYSANVLNYNKIALKYKSADYALWINGIEVATNANTNAVSGLNSLQFDAGWGTGKFFGNTKGLKYYPKALADVQLEDLTKI